MPIEKDFKRLVRARMRKTGEAYTTARMQLLTRKEPVIRVLPVAAPAPSLAKVAGMSDDKVKAATGCDWERWVFALDRLKAYELSHRDIAVLIKEKYDTPSWWTQMVAVGYERIKGLRERGQQRAGDYSVSKSKTIAASPTAVLAAWKNGRSRKKWLMGAPLELRSKATSKSLRFGWPGNGLVLVSVIAKSPGKSVVTIEHTSLADKATAVEMKEFWNERLAALNEVLVKRANAA